MNTDAVIFKATEYCIRKCAAEEVDLLDLVWLRFIDYRSSLIGRQAGKDFLPLGLGLESRRKVKLVSPMVILIVAAVLAELGPGCQPTMEQITNAIRESAKSFGAAKSLVEQITAHLPRKLLELLQDSGTTDTLSGVAVPPVGASGPEIVFGTRFSCGKPNHFGPSDYSELMAQEDLKDYDLVVDEHDCLMPNKNENSLILKANREQRAMLWLIMTRAPGEITHREIAVLYDVAVDDWNRIYRPKVVLKQLLGAELRDRIIGLGHEAKRYAVYQSGWSFLWIRRHQNPDQSDLITYYREKGRIARLRAL
jgi:hypothetical protein